MSALGQKRTCAVHYACPLCPRKRTCAVQQRMSAESAAPKAGARCLLAPSIWPNSLVSELFDHSFGVVADFGHRSLNFLSRLV